MLSSVESLLTSLVRKFAGSSNVPVDEKTHYTLEALEAAMKADDREHIAPSMCYAYGEGFDGFEFLTDGVNVLFLENFSIDCAFVCVCGIYVPCCELDVVELLARQRKPIVAFLISE